MEVFLVARSVNQTDPEGWQYWVEQRPISYHKTKEGAELKVKNLLSDEISSIQDWLVDNPSYRPQKEQEINDLINNIVIFTAGTNGFDTEEHTLFTITPLLLEN